MRPPLRALATGFALLALTGVLGIALGDGPYLGLGELDPWLVAWALGLAGLLGCLPFALHDRNARRGLDPDRRWELAIAAWGAVCLAGVVLFGAIGLASGMSGADPAGSIAIVGLAECALIVAGVAVLVLTTG